MELGIIILAYLHHPLLGGFGLIAEQVVVHKLISQLVENFEEFLHY